MNRRDRLCLSTFPPAYSIISRKALRRGTTEGVMKKVIPFKKCLRLGIFNVFVRLNSYCLSKSVLQYMYGFSSVNGKIGLLYSIIKKIYLYIIQKK